ncbi:PD-(D/E)XK nuclease family protein [Gammaproteobacteria bacterium]|jgi:hypothetical protein|nr:PD-(D/E)XK nuclease family protein [Gammaproteobacteria bacterium]|tara:strand:- start:352 stop:1065 length:714 start_codon:yes stop_codon:yes gene_type:complete
MEIKKLSRFAVETSMKCERCFHLQYKHKISLPSFPFTLNLAVDNLCKNEFDSYRAKGEPHPIFIEHGIDAVPYAHPEIDNWRNNFRGAYYEDPKKGFKFGGAVDDLWLKPDGKLIIADVKATAKNIFDWEDTYSKYDYAKGYQRQLEMYQWVYRKLGFDVADEAYLVYFNGKKNEPMFYQQLSFDLHVIKLECNDIWVEDAIIHARSLLMQDELPSSSESCEKCNYLKKRWQLAQKN